MSIIHQSTENGCILTDCTLHFNVPLPKECYTLNTETLTRKVAAS